MPRRSSSDGTSSTAGTESSHRAEPRVPVEEPDTLDDDVVGRIEVIQESGG